MAPMPSDIEKKDWPRAAISVPEVILEKSGRKR